MADKVSTVPQVFERMGEVFNADKAAGVDVIFQFDLTGEGGGQYWVHVHDGSFDKGEGLHSDPTVTVTSAAEDYIKVVNGEMAAMSAFMAGKIKIKGDMGTALKLQNIFSFS